MLRRLCSRAPSTTSPCRLRGRRSGTGIADGRPGTAPVIDSLPRSSPSTRPGDDDRGRRARPRRGPMSTTQSAVRIVSSSCSTTISVLPMSPQPDQRLDQPMVVALVQADRRLVEDVQHAHQPGADLRRQPDPLRLAAGRAWPRRDRATGSRARRRPGTPAGHCISFSTRSAMNRSRSVSADVPEKVGRLADRQRRHARRSTGPRSSPPGSRASAGCPDRLGRAPRRM